MATPSTIVSGGRFPAPDKHIHPYFLLFFEIGIIQLWVVEINNYPGLRRILARIQGASEGVYWSIRLLMQRRRRVKRQVRWDNYFFPRPFKQEFL